jgi:hypothetical protein
MMSLLGRFVYATVCALLLSTISCGKRDLNEGKAEEMIKTAGG